MVRATRTEISVTNDHGALLVAVMGELTRATVDRFNNALDVADGDPVDVDLAKVTSMDRDGVAALVQACNAGVRLHVSGASRTVTSHLQHAGISSLLGDDD
jgi:anti-anti-sigma regulatory factor